MKRWIFISVLAIGLVSCTREPSVQSVQWRAGEALIPPLPSGLKSEPASRDLGGTEMSFLIQKIDGVPIEGGFYKKISEQGRPEFIHYRWVEDIPMGTRSDLLLLKAQKPFVASQFLKVHGSFSNKKIWGEPELIFELVDNPDPELAVRWQLFFEDSQGLLEEVRFDREFNILSQKRAGSAFIDGHATLFPMGPLKSQIQEVRLKNLKGDKTLTSKSVKVTTEADLVALSDENNQFNFSVEDSRFDQVQVFYYMGQALDWFKESLSFELPFLLEAELQKGFPEKTNTAFYFRQKIRLGEGDGEVFSRIPMDATIVTHESVHAIIESVSGLPFEKEGGSINEAFADFFTAVQLKTPRMGEVAYKKAAFKRSLDNESKFSDRNGGLYHDSLIISGLLWEASKKVGAKEVTEIAWQTLLRMNPWSTIEEFKTELQAVLQKQPAAVQKSFQHVLKKRGWLE